MNDNSDIPKLIFQKPIKEVLESKKTQIIIIKLWMYKINVQNLPLQYLRKLIGKIELFANRVIIRIQFIESKKKICFIRRKFF